MKLWALRQATTLLPIIGFIAVWQTVATAELVPAAFLPTPWPVAVRLAEQIRGGDFLFQFGQTALRLASGFAIAVVLGVGFGLMAATSRSGRRILEPVVRLFAPIPKIALYPAFMLTLGYGHSSKVALVVVDAVFPILLASFHGACAVEPKLVWSALSAGTPARAIAWRIILPAALPTILIGCRIGCVIACVSVFLAEMISSTDGLGHLLVMAARSYQVVDMFGPLVAISLTGLVSGLVLEAIQAWWDGAGR